MNTTKLTLSADARIVRQAKRSAKERHTSVSALFARYVENLAREHEEDLRTVGPLTRRASGLVSLPMDMSDGQLLEETLAAKHGM